MPKFGSMNNGVRWRYLIAATLLVFAQLVAGWHIPHEHPEAPASSSDCAIGHVMSNLNADVNSTISAGPCPTEATTAYTIPVSFSLARRSSADRPGPRAPPLA